jgi:hypothetical protein
LLYVAVQCDLTFLNQSHRTERKNRFAHRSGLEQRVCADRLGVATRPHPEPALRCDTTFIDHGYAGSGRGKMSHAI